MSRPHPPLTEVVGTGQQILDPETGTVLVQDGVLARAVHVIASPYKTGTTSVGQALLDLGVGTRAMPYTPAMLQNQRDQIRTANEMADHSKGLRDFTTRHSAEIRSLLADLVAAIAPFDVFPDVPFGHAHIHPFVRKVLAPQARFIWVERDQDSWLASVRNWETSHPDLYPRHIEWEQDPEARAALKINFWKQRQRRFRRLTRGAPKDCLTLQWSDLNDYTALARFYDVDAPDTPFPQRNVFGGSQPESTKPGILTRLRNRLSD